MSNYIIRDWAGNHKFPQESFVTIDEADEFLTSKIEELYPETIDDAEAFAEWRGEYYIDTKTKGDL